MPIVLRSRAGFLLAAGLAVLAAGLAWWGYATFRAPSPPPSDSAKASAAPISSDCAQCHQPQYDSWQKTFHRTMTREATPENVKGDFANAHYDYQGLTTRLSREGDAFFMDTAHPDWAALRAKLGPDSDQLPAPRYTRFSVDRLVGSHWIQECLHRTANGRYVRLPVLYHLGEKRWLHSNGAFLTPDMDDFWAQSRSSNWNDSCLYCHNTEPSKNPNRDARGRVVGYQSEVLELGIACAACHGPGVDHAASGKVTDVVHPSRLSVPRRDEVCARCHGSMVPKASMWDPVTHRDPFVPGQELTTFNTFFWSEAEQAVLMGVRQAADKPPHPEPNDGRYWGDGTPLTTALEYNGMALSKCYQNGRGQMSCLSCHTMHGDDPSFLLKAGMATNEACYQCHGEYREKLAEHTRHLAASAGSLCANCHMPHQVYSLMTTHRSHRIQVPDIASSRGTGKPHACNLCHLDKSLGWTRDELARWPGQRQRPTLTPDEESISAAILTLAQGDARSRVIVAGAFSNPDALKASGTDWAGPFLTRLVEDERYPAVRYLAHRGLRTIYGNKESSPFNYVGRPAERSEQLRRLRDRFDASPVGRSMPFLPLTPIGLPDEAVLKRLLANRKDPDLTINE